MAYQSEMPPPCGRTNRLRCDAGRGPRLGMSADLAWPAIASQHECAQASGVRFGLPPVAGLAIGMIPGVSACWLGLIAAQLRPLVLAVPTAIVLLPLTAEIYLGTVDVAGCIPDGYSRS